MSRTSATVSSVALATLCALAMATAHAQDERRRPGSKAPRPTVTQPAPEQAPPETKAPPAPPEPPAPKRRRPGSETTTATPTAPPPPTAAPVEAAAPEVAEPTGRRRPGQAEFSKPNAIGERIETGSPSGERKQFDVNRRSK